MTIQRIVPCLWFDQQAEEAAHYYCGIFPNSRIVEVTRFTEAGREQHGKEPGSLMTVMFELDGQPFTALNGGPLFRFNEAVSFEVECVDQKQVDYYWERLSAGGDESAQQCGWLKDRFGVSWQVVPTELKKLVNDPDRDRAQRALQAMFGMKKLDIAEMRRAAAG